jgi:predicted RNA-binding Zn-ribbon protein involved in translation (DUF1610 family)
MSLTDDSRYNHPWDYPDCPDCGRHIYVGRSNTAAFDFVCHKCGVFDSE